MDLISKTNARTDISLGEDVIYFVEALQWERDAIGMHLAVQSNETLFEAAKAVLQTGNLNYQY